MFEVFEEVFEEVMEMFGMKEWWELFDSEEFSVVEEKLVERFGESVLESEEFCSWVGEMGGDL
jgi:hypothetical protein